MVKVSSPTAGDPAAFRRRGMHLEAGIEETEIDPGRVFGINREVHAIALPRRAERIGMAEPDFECTH